MEGWRVAANRIRGFFAKKSHEEELDAELRRHLEMLTEENIRRGMSPEEARHAAKREFGGVEQTKVLHREQRGLPFLENVIQDLRHAARMLLKNPGFTAVAVLTLALGIGATTAVFSVVDRLLFRSLPYPEGDRLVSFGVKAPFESLEFLLGPDYVEWRQRQTPFVSVTSMVPGGGGCDLSEQHPVHLNCAFVEANFLETFGIRPILGRDLARSDNRPKAQPVALLSSGLWHARFGGDPGVIGRTISLEDRAVVLVGVLPAEFEMPTLEHPDLVLPAELDESTDRGPNARQLIVRAFARLKPGVTIEQAYAAMKPLFAESLNYVPPQFRHEVSFRVRSLRDHQIADSRRASWILLGAVLTVLLVACTNVASLLVARAAARQRELAVRAALGATRVRLMLHNLAESVLLGALGGFVGSWLAYFLLRVFISVAPEGIPHLTQARLDMRVLVFTLGISLLFGMLFGLVPALRTPAPELLAGKEGRTTARSLLRHALVSVQIALSLVLLAGASLLLRSLWKLETAPLGMNAESTLVTEITLSPRRYPSAETQLAFFRELEARLKRIPGVTSLGLSDSLPPSAASRATFLSAIEILGQPRFTGGTGGMIGWRTVSPDYFSALRVPVVRGRGFRGEDLKSKENVVILSDALGRRLFPAGVEPLGKQLRFGGDGPWRTIVGVAGDVKNNGLAAPPDPEFYLPWKTDPQGFYRSAAVIVRSQIDSRATTGWIRSEVAALDPTLPLTIEPLATRVGKLADRQRFNAMLLSLFAAIGVMLAAVGMHGVVGFVVAQRTREIGVRMALGASPGAVLQMILLHVARWLLSGALIGLLGALFLTRLLQSLLFEVQPRDPLLLGMAVLALIVVGLVAAWIPARRAMRVDPLIALRYE